MSDEFNTFHTHHPVDDPKPKTDGVNTETYVPMDPRERAAKAGIVLRNLSAVWFILSVLGSIILMTRTECVSEGTYGCYDTGHPYVGYSIAALFITSIMCTFLFAIGSYIEARMSDSK